MKPNTQEIHDYLKSCKGKAKTPQHIAKVLGLPFPSTRTALYRLTYNPNVNIYRVGQGEFTYSDVPVGTKATVEARILEWWEQHKGEKVTPLQASKEIGDLSRQDCSNRMSAIARTIGCCYRIADGTYIWDEENTHEYKSQLDTVVDFLIEKGGKATLAEMEFELGIHKSSICRVLSNVQSQKGRAKIKRVSYVVLEEDNR